MRTSSSRPSVKPGGGTLSTLCSSDEQADARRTVIQTSAPGTLVAPSPGARIVELRATAAASVATPLTRALSSTSIMPLRRHASLDDGSPDDLPDCREKAAASDERRRQRLVTALMTERLTSAYASADGSAAGAYAHVARRSGPRGRRWSRVREAAIRVGSARCRLGAGVYIKNANAGELATAKVVLLK